jgi:hypothetical protein
MAVTIIIETEQSQLARDKKATKSDNLGNDLHRIGASVGGQ